MVEDMEHTKQKTMEKESEGGAGQTDLFSFGENTLSSLKETITTTTREYQFIEPLRKCSTCGLLKPLSEFGRHKASETGRIKKHRRTCKECGNLMSIQWRKDNPEKVKEYNRKWWEDHEKATKYHREWREKNPEKIREKTFYLHVNGSCMLCGKIEPRAIISHHLFPNCDFVISLCADCHRMFQTGDQERHMLNVQNAIEKSPFLWKDVKISKNVEMFNPEDVIIVDTISGFNGKQIGVVKSISQEKVMKGDI